MSIEVPEPTPEDRLEITSGLTIPSSELGFRFSRSSGPGGQHVNRTESRVELLFDIAHSPSLSDEQRARLLNRLSGYVDGEGVLHLFSSITRSQLANRADVIARFRVLLHAALRQRRRRLPTQPSAAGRERRLRAKRERSEVKQARRRTDIDY